MIRLDYKESNFINTFSMKNKPIVYLECNELIEVQTPRPGITTTDIQLFNEGRKEPKRMLRIVGPIFIRGIKKGDVLKVSVHSVEVDAIGKSWFGPWIGLLKNQVDRSTLKEYQISGDKIWISDDMCMDVKPMIGTLGITPLNDVPCLTPGDYGGNMDIPTLSQGSSLYLKSYTDGALLGIGDIHAIMGYGEVVGTGIEVGGKVVLSVTKCEDNLSQIPLHEDINNYEIINSDPIYRKAVESVVKKAIAFLMERNNITFEEAYFLVGEFCDLLLTQVVNPSVTAMIRIPKKIVKRLLGE